MVKQIGQCFPCRHQPLPKLPATRPPQSFVIPLALHPPKRRRMAVAQPPDGGKTVAELRRPLKAQGFRRLFHFRLDFPGKRLVRFLILLPWTTPIALGVIGWLWMLDSLYSPIDAVLRMWRMDGERNRRRAVHRQLTAKAPSFAV